MRTAEELAEEYESRAFTNSVVVLSEVCVQAIHGNANNPMAFTGDDWKLSGVYRMNEHETLLTFVPIDVEDYLSEVLG